MTAGNKEDISSNTYESDLMHEQSTSTGHDLPTQSVPHNHGKQINFVGNSKATTLSLAQTKFDELRNILNETYHQATHKQQTFGYKSNKIKTPSSCVASLEEIKEMQLLSSLLYLSLMMHKVEDLKNMLKGNNAGVYSEWQSLIEQLHPPAFHERQYLLNNERVKKIYKRKHKYQEMYRDALDKMANLERATQQLSTTLSNIHGENLKLKEQLIAEKEQHKEELAMVNQNNNKFLEKLNLQIKDSEQAVKIQLKDLRRENESIKCAHVLLEEKAKSQEINNLKIQHEMEILQKSLIVSQEKAQSLETELSICNHEKEIVQQQLSSQKLELEEKEKKIIDIYNKIQNTEVVLLDAFQNHTKGAEIELNKQNNELHKQNHELQLSLMGKEKEIETISMEIITYQDTVSSLKADLESKSNALNNALEAIKIEQMNQGKLKAVVSVKENEILKLEELRKGLEVKLELLEHSNQTIAEGGSNSSS